MNLHEFKTVHQFLIGSWLAEQGISDELITSIDTSDPDAITVYNALGSLRARWVGDHAEIDRGAEIDKGEERSGSL